MQREIDKQKLLSLMEIYKKHLEKELGTKMEDRPRKPTTIEYKEFKAEFLPKHMGWYEKLCNLSEKLLKIKPDQKKAAVIQEAIDITHLSITPAGATSFSILIPLLAAVFGSLLAFVIFQSTFFVLLFLVISLFMIKPLGKAPEFMANNWRLKASNQMVLCIFYTVTYMRHTSNLERAIEFAAEHLAPPLSLDLKKVLWDVETEKYSSVKESLDIYLETWKKWNVEFIEAFHLIESSLYEGDEARRLNALDKSLDVILDETYEKMLHYAHNLQNPITMLHMLGIILPILGLVILPLVVSFMENVRWYHLAVIYNVILTVVVYYLGKNILSKRPTGYGDTDISEENPELKKYKNILIRLGNKEIQITPLIISVFLGVILLIIGLSPLIFHAIGVADFGIGGEDPTTSCQQRYCLLGYRISATTSQEIGPYGLGASLLSLFLPLSLGIGIGLYYRLRSKNIIKIREKAKKLELEFAAALFQLGNRLGDNLPVEIAVGKVANVMEGTISGSFFQLVSLNIRRLGMSIDKAIFDPLHGALVSFPSNLIESSMKVLTQAIKKGPLIAAQALTNVARYIKEIHKVNERLKDLMADIISSMQSQIKFLTPAIAGVVIGITSMITAILGKLSIQLQETVSSVGGAEGGAPTSILGLFGDGIPTYFFQLIVGIYVVQITYILTIIANGVENGSDKLNERYQLGNNLIRSTILYVIISAAVMLIFNIISGRILSATVGG
ncbi:hypothetical protein CMO83_04000 [Candidatus Woesearchaeota archaeon]|jgi:hypothetical protein|nr:hypothetical protein [Candidatus Woesearchaeota archaeon]|tara:strand:- start:18680 stop:20866 length:2187 start_codon:yes stop_codon:yes gene_type:complete